MGRRGGGRRARLIVPGRRVRSVAVALAVALTTTLVACQDGDAAPATEVAAVGPSEVAQTPAAPHPGLADYRVARPPTQVARPVRLRIPALGVDSPLDELGQAADRTVEVPSNPLRAGWYGLGPRPGQAGPAVILGHVDGKSRPGVFFRVRELDAGAEVVVDRADGSSARFRATRVTRMPKSAFPTGEVYLPTAGSELRLVTCGGSFDASTQHYRDNVIAYAVLVR